MAKITIYPAKATEKMLKLKAKANNRSLTQEILWLVLKGINSEKDNGV